MVELEGQTSIELEKSLLIAKIKASADYSLFK
jgi:hypothetical protein